jgi:hypothetical protein
MKKIEVGEIGVELGQTTADEKTERIELVKEIDG